MALLNVGSSPNDGTGESLRSACQKLNAVVKAKKQASLAGDVTADVDTGIYEFSSAGNLIVPLTLGTMDQTCTIKVRNKSSSPIGIYKTSKTSGNKTTEIAAQSDGGGAGFALIEIDGVALSIDGVL